MRKFNTRFKVNITKVKLTGNPNWYLVQSISDDRLYITLNSIENIFKKTDLFDRIDVEIFTNINRLRDSNITRSSKK